MYSTFIKHIIYPLYEFYTQRNVLKHLRELKQTQWLSSGEIKKIQWMKLKKILEYTYTNVSYYHRMFKTLNMTPKDIVNPRDFRKLPIIDKETIRNNLNAFVSSNYEKKDLVEHFTAGSTGENLRFFLHNKNMEHRLAVEFRGDQWAGLYIGDKQARLWGAPIADPFQTTFKGKFNNLIFRQLLLSSYNLSKESMHEYTKKLLQYKPKTIFGYSSSLYLFARFLDENKIEGIKPKSVVSTAEVLYDYQRELIESVFGCKVFNRYGCNEFSVIAQECSEHSGMHISAEHVYVECLKDDGKPASPGERGELIITDLDNYTFPFIRYRIGDISILSNRECPCGRGLPLLGNVEGRVWDVIVGANGNLLIGGFYLVKGIEGIKQFQILQEKLGEIIIKLVIDESFIEKEKYKLLKRIYEVFGEDMKVEIRLMDEIPLSKSGKRRFVISKVSPFVK